MTDFHKNCEEIQLVKLLTEAEATIQECFEAIALTKLRKSSISANLLAEADATIQKNIFASTYKLLACKITSTKLFLKDFV